MDSRNQPKRVWTEQELIDIKYWAQAKAGKETAIIGGFILIGLALVLTFLVWALSGGQQ